MNIPAVADLTAEQRSRLALIEDSIELANWQKTEGVVPNPAQVRRFVRSLHMAKQKMESAAFERMIRYLPVVPAEMGEPL